MVNDWGKENYNGFCKDTLLFVEQVLPLKSFYNWGIFINNRSNNIIYKYLIKR